MKLTHLNAQGEAKMVDISGKAPTKRIAIAESTIRMNKATFDLLQDGGHPKGDVFACVRIAGIQAAKQCSNLIPLCHPLMINKVDISLQPNEHNLTITITAKCEIEGKTGVEMEALTAVSISALTLYDMCKASDKGMIIESTQLIEKKGGKSGNWLRT